MLQLHQAFHFAPFMHLQDLQAGFAILVVSFKECKKD